jgi:uncharacterized protein (DUF433 family)
MMSWLNGDEGNDTRTGDMQLAERIEVDPTIRFGRPVIAGTRVPVDLVIAKLAGGMESDEVAAEYGLALEDVRAALSYAAQVLNTEEVRARP